MAESEAQIQACELPINRAIHLLRQGVPEGDITAERIGVAAEQLIGTIDTAKLRMVANDQAYAVMTRKGALGYIGFGIVILGMALYLAHGDVPFLRQGRLILICAIGGASVVWGLFRLFNHDPRYEF